MTSKSNTPGKVALTEGLGPLPEADGTAEANKERHPEGGYTYDEVPAWSEPLVRAYAAQEVAAERERCARKPLTHMQIVMLWGDRSDGPSTPEIVSFARVVERAHGIGA